MCAYSLPLSSPTPPRLRRYPFLVHDEDRDSLSSLDSEDGHFHAAPSFMRLLEDLSRRSPTGRRSPIRQRSHRSHFWDRQRPHRYDVDEDLQQVLELSRQEYEAQTRLNAGSENTQSWFPSPHSLLRLPHMHIQTLNWQRH